MLATVMAMGLLAGCGSSSKESDTKDTEKTETTEEGSWRDSSLTRKERFAIKNHAKGTPDKVWFHYLLKNYNILTAIVYSISPYIRILLGK